MKETRRRALRAAVVWACVVAACAVALIASERAAAGNRTPVVLSAFFPGDDYSSDMRDEEQVAPLEDPSMPSEGGEYSAMGDGDDDDAIQGLYDNPAMAHVATGRVFEVQRQLR